MRPIQTANVCVVGGAGFLGSHLVNHLIEDRGCTVMVIDNLVTGRREFLHPQAAFEHWDITGSESYLFRLFTQYQTQFVFNYAAEPYIPVSFERPLYVCDTNAFGAMKVINAAQEVGCKGILQVSSAELYGNCKGAIDEAAPVEPHSSYGVAKAAVDAFVQVRWREAKTPCIALRQFNCVGERETHPYVIPEIISQLSESTTVKLGNNSTRDFLYAGDAVRMAVDLVERGQFGEVYNLGSEECVEIYKLAEMVGQVMGHDRIEIEEDWTRRRPWEIWHLQSNNSKLYSVIDSRPEVPLMSALKRTIKDFQTHGWSWCKRTSS
jgi:nucleoside-diphosphate-sugar epimerase